MRLYERVASTLIGTPLQGPAEWLRWARGYPRRLKHPELRELFREGERTKALLKQTITESMNCMDIGCHLGSMLQEMVTLAPKGRHIAVEPLPYKAELLRRKFAGATVHQVALGDAPGTVEFFHDEKQSGFSGLRPHRAQANGSTLQVECKRLDDVVPAGMPLGFIKLDVEGGECAVFRGSARVLAECRPIVLFECTQSGMKSFGVAPDDVFGVLERAGYGIFLLKDWLDPPARRPLDPAAFRASMTYPFQAFNYVAAPL